MYIPHVHLHVLMYIPHVHWLDDRLDMPCDQLFAQYEAAR